MSTVTPLGAHLAAEARRVLANTRHTHYQHHIEINEETGTYNVDCSAFVTYVIGNIAPNHLKPITMQPKETRLHAGDYYRFFASLPTTTSNGWQRISALDAAVPGDLVAWALPAPNRDTGHIFIVADTPLQLDDETAAVPAYDASEIRHYDDSRGTNATDFRSGVGAGTLHIQFDAAGNPTAFQLGPGDPMVENAIAIARITPFRVEAT